MELTLCHFLAVYYLRQYYKHANKNKKDYKQNNSILSNSKTHIVKPEQIVKISSWSHLCNDTYLHIYPFLIWIDYSLLDCIYLVLLYLSLMIHNPVFWPTKTRLLIVSLTSRVRRTLDMPARLIDKLINEISTKFM